MKQRGKAIRNGILLGLLCVGLVAAYFIISANENPAAKGVLYELRQEQIERIELKNTFGDFAFYQQDGAWVVESNGVYRTNPEKMDLLLGCLGEFAITRMLTDEKAEYGFDEPQAQVEVVTSRGNSYRFTVGNDAISGSSVYIKSGGNVMLTSTAMTSQLTGSLAAYRAKDVLMVDPAAIRSIEYMVDGTQTLTLSNTDYHHWSITYPFTVPAREVILNELVAKLRTLVIAGYVDAESKAQKTGLTNPQASMILTDENGVTQRLDFGSIQDTVQYVRIGSESDIVQLYASDLDFSALTPEGVMYIAPLDIPVDTVKSVSIAANGMVDVLLLDRGGESTIATLNGKPIDYAESFVSVYFKCITVNADGYEAKPSDPGAREAVITVTKTDDTIVELSLYRRDDQTLYLYVDGEPVRAGGTMFYSDAVSLTELLYRLQKAKASQ